MAHPHNEHRAHHVEHRRVAHITKGYGGHSIGSPHRADHTDEPEDRALVKAMVKPGALKHKPHGGKVKHRLDKPHRAKGGRVKHAKTNVNVIVGHGGPSGPPPMPVPVPAAGPVAAVPRPPMAGPMLGMAPALPPGGPMLPPPGAPPMGPRKAGGRTYKSGGRVGAMPGYASTKKHATAVQHTDGKKDGKDIGRGRQITYKRGGIVT